MPIGSVELPASQLSVFLKVCETYVGKPSRRDETTSLDSILIYTDSGTYGADVGKATILVGLSSDGVSASYFSRTCSGSLNEPILIEQSRLKTIYPWLGFVAAEGKREGGEDPVVHWSVSNGGASTMRASATTAESLKVHVSTAEDYPEREVQAILRAGGQGDAEVLDSNNRPLPVGAMFSFGTPSTKVAAVKKILGGRMDYYPPAHPAGMWVAEDKSNGWRGAFPADQYGADDDVDTPEVELLLRELG